MSVRIDIQKDRIADFCRRNRIRRLLREAFRLSQHDIPAGFDFVLVPRTQIEVSLDGYRQSLLTLAKQAAGKVIGGKLC